jgi:hypothetical protein
MDPHHLGVPSGAPKKISLHVVHSAQTVHLSFTEINTFSKRTQMSFHLTHITEEFDRVRPKWSPSLLHIWRKSCTYLALKLTLSPKWFPSLWYIHRKPCTNITLRLAPSLNWPKRASTWPMSCRSTIGCVQNDFLAYGTFSANHAPILR